MYLSLTPEGLILAYSHGIFPMADSSTGEIFWFQPDPRTIIPLDRFHISRSLAKTLRKGIFEVTVNTDFTGVMRGCANREEGTWISEEFIALYTELYRQGFAHSVECRLDGKLVGGTYGIALGGAFMAESMFHTVTDASKVALAGLVSRMRERGFAMLDVQYLTPNLARLGAVEIPHKTYYRWLQMAQKLDCEFG